MPFQEESQPAQKTVADGIAKSISIKQKRSSVLVAFARDMLAVCSARKPYNQSHTRAACTDLFKPFIVLLRTVTLSWCCAGFARTTGGHL
jgi:hypothetical protein